MHSRHDSAQGASELIFGLLLLFRWVLWWAGWVNHRVTTVARPSRGDRLSARIRFTLSSSTKTRIEPCADAGFLFLAAAKTFNIARHGCRI
ncbi:hypothetical protein ABH944_007799 [Caballeronia udeis]|uniref:Secreted protein n=1 Tax=Caballeronia udeis TaxID=1232866 RepID=A0ABW8MUQ1_9BURK